MAIAKARLSSRRWRRYNVDGYMVVLTLGRNVGRLPMSEADWFGYRKQVANDLDDVQAAILQRPKMLMGNVSQVGQWDGADEEACTFVAVVSTLGKLERLSRAVRFTRAAYNQEAIGFIALQGTRHFV